MRPLAAHQRRRRRSLSAHNNKRRLRLAHALPKWRFRQPLRLAQQQLHRLAIFQTHQGPLPNSQFSVNNAYVGPVGSQWVIVYAGTLWTSYPSTGIGALAIYDQATLKPIATVKATDGASSLTLISAQGTLLTVKTNTGATLTFNLTTDAFQ